MTLMRPTQYSIYHIAAIVFVFFSFFISALIHQTVFERMPHLEDEMAYIFQARIFARGDVVVDIPQPRRAFWQPFVVDYDETGARFGKYTPGWPALLAIGVNLGQMWVINAFFAALTIALVYRLGREICSPDAGLMAAALVAFSPMALLLNASFMGHTAALTCFTLFMWCYWRMERAGQRERLRSAVQWGVVGGVALGLLVVNRPLTAVGVGAPFVLWSGFKVLRAVYHDLTGGGERRLLPTFTPLLAIALFTVVISATIPLFNHTATGDPFKNLYTLIWPYDRVGFGECCGRNVHTIIKGILHTRYDLSLTAADLFGWQAGLITPELQEHLRTRSNYWPVLGFSFLLLPFGLLAGFRRSWLRGWALVGMMWLVVPLALNMSFLRDTNNMTPAWLWLGVGAAWMLLPPLLLAWSRHRDSRSTWTWLLLGVIVGLVGAHLTYWVGSQRYSTRYYFEALTAFALLSALPLAWLARRTSRPAIYGLLALALLWSLYVYSTPRINALYRFNFISPEQIEMVEACRIDDRPALVIVTGTSVRWRAHGSLMAVTGPHLDDEIVVAWDYAPGTDVRQSILERFPDRQVIEMEAHENEAWLTDADCER
jgi:4-amino-4-deoxy-L-arabinose transferase-like glycosyltransferase